jgi:DNA repair exonuclease SbcCD ATPase subunit
MARRGEQHGTDLDREIDALYRLPLDDFTESRNALAARVKKEGQPTDAAAVRGLAKPTVTAWAVNQVWWTDRRAFEAMLDAGHTLREAQRASLEGRSAGLREAVERRQAAIGTVVELAMRAMGGSERVSAPLQQRLGATCDVLAGGLAPEGTRLGRLTHDLEPSGLSVLSALSASVDPLRPPASRTPARRPATVTPFPVTRGASPSPGRATTPAPAQPAAPPRTGERRREEARARIREAFERATVRQRESDSSLEIAERALAERRGAVEDAERACAQARARIADLERDLERARAEEARLRAALAAARRETSAAESEVTRARREAERARSLVERLQ